MTAQLVVVVAAVVAALILVVRFELFCLRDLAHTADAELRYLTRAGWIALIALVIPLGGAMYLYAGKFR